MKCVLCGLIEDNIDLLICCPFSKSIWYNLCNKCNISCVRRNSKGFICWISHFRGKSFPLLWLDFFLTYIHKRGGGIRINDLYFIKWFQPIELPLEDS